ncbi:MAG TPA: hypothetical protein DIW44_04710 [Anaerolineaceae bacterium]|nr:hypothetical protein [Anaerolineaceae bacterium]
MFLISRSLRPRAVFARGVLENKNESKFTLFEIDFHQIDDSYIGTNQKRKNKKPAHSHHEKTEPTCQLKNEVELILIVLIKSTASIIVTFYLSKDPPMVL